MDVTRTATRIAAGVVIATGVALGGGGVGPAHAHAAHVDARHVAAHRPRPLQQLAPDALERALERLIARHWHPPIKPRL